MMVLPEYVTAGLQPQSILRTVVFVVESVKLTNVPFRSGRLTVTPFLPTDEFDFHRNPIERADASYSVWRKCCDWPKLFRRVMRMLGRPSKAVNWVR